MPTNITSPVESLQPTAIDPLHISSNSKLIYCNGQGGFTKVSFTDPNLEIIFRKASGTPGTNILKQFESILSNLPGVDSWYINLINGIIYIHNQDYNDTPVSRYIFKNEPGELLEVQIKLQNKHTDPTDKIINSVQSMLSSYTASQRARDIALLMEENDRVFNENKKKPLTLSAVEDAEKDLFYTEGERYTLPNGEVRNPPGKTYSIKAWEFAKLGASSLKEDRDKYVDIMNRLTQKSLKKWDLMTRTVKINGQSTKQVGILDVALDERFRSNAFYRKLNDTTADKKIKDPMGEESITGDINKGSLLLNRGIFRQWAMNNPKAGNEKCIELLKTVNLDYVSALDHPDTIVTANFHTESDLLGDTRFFGATVIEKLCTLSGYTAYNRSSYEKDRIIRDNLSTIKTSLKSALTHRVYEGLYSAYGKGFDNYIISHCTLRWNPLSSVISDTGGNQPGGEYVVSFTYIGGDSLDVGLTVKDITDILQVINPRLGHITKSYQGGNTGPSLRNTALRKKRETELVANVTVVGRPSLISGKDIEIHNIGKKYSGIWFIRRCIHTINPSQGYITKMELVLKRAFG